MEIGGDQRVGVEAALGEQPLNSYWVLDEGAAVLFAALAFVGLARELEGGIELPGTCCMPFSRRCLVDQASSLSYPTLALFAGALELDLCN